MKQTRKEKRVEAMSLILPDYRLKLKREKVKLLLVHSLLFLIFLTIIFFIL